MGANSRLRAPRLRAAIFAGGGAGHAGSIPARDNQLPPSAGGARVSNPAVCQSGSASICIVGRAPTVRRDQQCLRPTGHLADPPAPLIRQCDSSIRRSSPVPVCQYRSQCQVRLEELVQYTFYNSAPIHQYPVGGPQVSERPIFGEPAVSRRIDEPCGEQTAIYGDRARRTSRQRLLLVWQ